MARLSVYCYSAVDVKYYYVTYSQRQGVRKPYTPSGFTVYYSARRLKLDGTLTLLTPFALCICSDIGITDCTPHYLFAQDNKARLFAVFIVRFYRCGLFF